MTSGIEIGAWTCHGRIWLPTNDFFLEFILPCKTDAVRTFRLVFCVVAVVARHIITRKIKYFSSSKMSEHGDL